MWILGKASKSPMRKGASHCTCEDVDGSGGVVHALAFSILSNSSPIYSVRNPSLWERDDIRDTWLIWTLGRGKVNEQELVTRHRVEVIAPLYNCLSQWLTPIHRAIIVKGRRVGSCAPRRYNMQYF